MTRSIVAMLGGALVASCGGSVDYGTAVLGLGEVPEEVATISVFVTRLGSAQVVATATLTGDQTRVALGVPAEVPLEFTAIARSDRPASALLSGRMPVYAARTVRTVPLGREALPIALDARPAGGLTVRLDGPEDARGQVPLRLVGVAELVPLRLGVPATGGRWSRALAEGRWGLAVDDEDWVIPGGEGLWVAQGVESVARLRLTPATVLLPDVPQKLVIEVIGSDGAPVGSGAVVTSTAGPARLTVRVRALDGRGVAVPVAPARVSVRASSVPPGAWVFPVREAVGLPAELSDWMVSGEARIRVTAEAELGDGRGLRATWLANLGGRPGPATHVTLELDEPDAVAQGTIVRALLLDADDRLAAPAPWSVDLADSDPWVFFSDGTTAQGSRPVLELPMAQPSGPLGLGVAVRVTATSTAFAGTLTSTLTLLGVDNGSGAGGGG